MAGTICKSCLSCEYRKDVECTNGLACPYEKPNSTVLCGKGVSEWLEDSDPGQEYGTTWACRECGHSLHEQHVWNPYQVNWRYCPWCGRRMVMPNETVL